jgi:hypothetical protein
MPRHTAREVTVSTLSLSRKSHARHKAAKDADEDKKYEQSFDKMTVYKVKVKLSLFRRRYRGLQEVDAQDFQTIGT